MTIRILYQFATAKQHTDLGQAEVERRLAYLRTKILPGTEVEVATPPVGPGSIEIMGDLRVFRNVILHAKGIIRPDKHASLRVLGEMFEADKEIVFSYEGMHKIFVFIKQDCARLLFGWLGVEDGPVKPEQLKDVAIQFGPQHSQKAKPDVS